MKKRQDMPDIDASVPPTEMQRTELQARQIDLETQNEELLQARDLLEESRDRYIDFYDFSPVGYLTLSHKALITEINLTGAAMLGDERSNLRRRRFAEFLALEDNDFWNRHFMAARQHEGKLTCELGILRGDGSRIDVQIDSLRLARDGGEPVVRLALTDITERKRAEAALRSSEAQRRLLEQQKIIQTSLDGFWVTRVKDARILEANEAFCNMVGYSRAELLTMCISELEANESPDEIAAHIKKVMAIGHDRFETRHRHKQGHLIDLEVSVSYSESDGGVNFVFVRDITERKFAEQYERFRSHILELLSGADSLPDILESLVRGVEQLNPAMICSILLLEGNRLGHGITPSLPDFYNTVIEGIEIGIGIGSCGTAAASGERVIVEDIRTHPYWAPFKELAAKAGLGACWSQPILSSAGQVLGTFAIYHREVHTPTVSDISIIEQAAHLASIAIERKLAEALLVQREREFRSLTENLPDNIVRYNREGVTIYVNPALERTMEDLATSMIGTTPREFHPDGTYEDYAQLLDTVLASGEAGELEKALPGPDGLVCIHQIRMIPEHGEDGEVVGVVAIGRDITERKLAELERQAHARSLECLDRVNKAIQGTNDLDQMMRAVLDIALASLGCDRAFLLYPCDPEVDEWQVPMERTRPEYPGAHALGITTMPMDSEAAKALRITRDASGPVMFGPGAEYPLPSNVSGGFGFKSELLMAVHPKLGKPWIFGIHQCAHAKVWTEDEVNLFRKIGWRLSDALTSLLMYRDLRTSERQFRTLAENMPFILVRYDREGHRTYVNPAAERNFGFQGEQVIGTTLPEINPLRIPTVEAYQRALKHTLITGERSEFEMQVSVASGDVRIGNTVIVAERDADGEICGAITIGRDITKLKQTERQLRELAAHLQSAREEEKAHLARELHDDLGQILFLLKLKVSGHSHDCMANSGAICGPLQEALTLTDRAIGTARNIVAALRPPALDYGFAAALKWLVENFVENMNIQCELQIEDEEIRLDESKSLALFRIAQEALNNVAKHAQADRVEIALSKEATGYVLSVRDNGTGFDTGEKKKGSFGLVGMRERAIMHGGTVSIESRAGGGTEIVVRIAAD